MRTYLFLAVFWLLAAGFVFAYSGAQQYTILNSEWSIGWLLLLFAGWHLMRFWMTRSKSGSNSDDPDADGRNLNKL